jgi:hypothetical protein
MMSSIASTSTALSSSSLAKLFQKADANGDNTLSQDELVNALSGAEGSTGTSESVADLFDSIDSDGDGTLSQNEFNSFAQMFSSDSGQALLAAQEEASLKEEESTQQSSLFETLDTDSDGSVSESEFTAALQSSAAEEDMSEDDITKLFASIDTDGDSTISAQELQNAMGVMTAPPPSEDLATDEEASANASSVAASDSTDDSEESSASSGSSDDDDYDPLDTNEDGVVSASERAAGEMDSFGLLNGATLGGLMQFNEVSQAA